MESNFNKLYQIIVLHGNYVIHFLSFTCVETETEYTATLTL